MECRQCGGNRFRRIPRTAFLQEAVSKLGFAAWECRECHKICVVRHHGLAMVMEGGPYANPKSVDRQHAPVAPLTSRSETETGRPVPSYSNSRPVPIR